VGSGVGASFLRQVIVVALAAAPATALAFHRGDPSTNDAVHGPLEVALATFLAASAIFYGGGVASLWRKAGIGRGIRRMEVLYFIVGSIALAGALLSPLDEVAGRSFAMHMVQHELLMIVAAPLFVLARPLEAWAWALPIRAQRAVARIARVRVAGICRRVGEPGVAWSVHALALWTWHLPALFVAALASAPWHVLQHVCFFASALAFWWAVFGGGTRSSNGMCVACLFTTMLHTSALGALLTFAPAPWYAISAEPEVLGLTALEDQQLGGLLMWVPGSLAYLVAGLVIVGGWLSPPRVQHDVR
jgi:putative membrane protein